MNDKTADYLLPSEEERYKNHYLGVLNHIKAKQNIEGELPSKSGFFHIWVEQVPFLEKLINHLDEVGASTGELIEMKEHFSHAAKIADSATRAFSFVSLGVAIVDFIRIPAIFIASAILGREVPFKLKNAAKWGYSAAILGLSIATVAVPAIAPVIAVVVASLALSIGVFTLGRFIYKRNQKRSALSQLTKEHGDIDIAEEELEKIQIKANEFMNKMSVFEALDQNQQDTLLDKVDKLELKFKAKKAEVQKLYNKRKKLEVALESSDGIVINKSIALVLSAAALTGFALSLVFPPVGIAVLLSASIAATVLIAANAALPRIKKTSIGAWLAARFRSKEEANQPENEISPAISDELEPEPPVHEKTVDIMRKLFGSAKAEDALRQLVLDTQKMEALDSHFTQITVKSDEKAMVLFFNRLAFKATIHKLTVDNVQTFFQQLGSFEQGRELLKAGLLKVQSGEFSSNIAENLFSNAALVKSLELEQYKPGKEGIASKDALTGALGKDEKEGEGEGEGKGEKEENKLDVH